MRRAHWGPFSPHNTDGGQIPARTAFTGAKACFLTAKTHTLDCPLEQSLQSGNNFPVGAVWLVWERGGLLAPPSPLENMDLVFPPLSYNNPARLPSMRRLPLCFPLPYSRTGF